MFYRIGRQENDMSGAEKIEEHPATGKLPRDIECPHCKAKVHHACRSHTITPQDDGKSGPWPMTIRLPSSGRPRPTRRHGRWRGSKPRLQFSIIQKGPEMSKLLITVKVPGAPMAAWEPMNKRSAIKQAKIEEDGVVVWSNHDGPMK